MNQIKKSMAMLMAAATIMGAAAPAALAATSDSSQTTPVQLTSEAAVFDVTVPTALPVSITAAGVVTTATDCKIINNSWGAIKVAGLAITGQNSWATTDYDTANMAAEKVNTKKVAMTINGDKTTGTNKISFTQTNFPKLDGVNATASDELAINYAAKVPAQAAALTGANIANVVFTIAWDTVI